MQKWQDGVVDQYGNAVVGATATVYNAGGLVPATIYSDNGITVTGNPRTTDAQGRYFFYGDGRFDITISGSRITTYTISDVLLQDYPALAALPASIYAAFAASSGSSLVWHIASGTGAAARTAQAKMRDWVNAQDYGTGMLSAPGADVNLAIDYIYGIGGGTVVLPRGTYAIETSILQKSRVTLVLDGTILDGTGLSTPIIKNATAVTSKSISGITNVGRIATATCTAHGYVANDEVHISGASPDGYNGWHKVVTAPTADTFTYYVDKNISADSGTISVFKYTERDLKIFGGELYGDASTTSAVKYDGVKKFTLSDIYAYGTQEDAINIFSGVHGHLERVTGENVLGATFNGILLGNSSTKRYADDMELIGCEGNGNGQDGILVERGHDVRFFSCGGSYNGLAGLKIGNATDVSASACWGKYNTASGAQIQSAAQRVTISKGNFHENGEAGILLTNPDTTNTQDDITIEGNQCHKNGQAGAASLPYGVAIEASVSSTINKVSVLNNRCNNQSRGVSVGTSGTVSNLNVDGNRCYNNTADIVLGSSVVTATLTLGVNYGAGASAHDAAYGQNIRRLEFSAENIPASSGTVVCTKPGPARGYVMPKTGWVKSIYGISNAAITAGTLTLTVRKNGVFLNNVSWTSGTTKTVEMDPQVYTFVAGDLIDLTYVSDGSLLPNGTADFDFIVEVFY